MQNMKLNDIVPDARGCACDAQQAQITQCDWGWPLWGTWEACHTKFGQSEVKISTITRVVGCSALHMLWGSHV